MHELGTSGRAEQIKDMAGAEIRNETEAKVWLRGSGMTLRKHDGERSLAPIPRGGYIKGQSERSAARLAHQSGGLGVPSSNLGAPTKSPLKINIFRSGGQTRAFRKSEQNGDKTPRSAPKVPKKSRTAFATRSLQMRSPARCQTELRGASFA